MTRGNQQLARSQSPFHLSTPPTPLNTSRPTGAKYELHKFQPQSFRNFPFSHGVVELKEGIKPASGLNYAMEALKAVGLNPLSVLAKRTEPKKNSSLVAISPSKNQAFPNSSNSDCSFSASRTLQGSLLFLSSVLSCELAKALTYEEALQQSLSSGSSSSASDIDINGVIDGFINFATENPLILGGGLAVLAVPLVVSQLISKPKPWGVESAKAAYAKLGEDANAQLLDIRAPGDIKQVGSPDIGGLKKKPVALVYKGEDKPGFLNKLALKFKEPEKTTLFILDK